MKKAYILVAITSMLFLSCRQNEYQFSTDGEYTITNSTIFLTALAEEKTDFYNTCVNKKVIIKSRKIFIDTACFDSAKRVLTDSFFRTPITGFPVFNEQSLSHYISGEIDYKEPISAVKAITTNPDGSNDSLFLIKKNDTMYYLLLDPYILELKKNK